MFPALLACVSAPPPDSERDVLTARDRALVLDGAEIMSFSAFAAEPTIELDENLVSALRPAAGRTLEVVLPPDTPVWIVRKIVGSAREAGVHPAAIGAIGSAERFSLTDPPRYGLEAACEEPRAVQSTEPLITLSVQTGRDGAWVIATAQFLPSIGGMPIDGLPASCVTVPSCDVLYPEAGAPRAACEEGGGERRVALGGPVGCMLPIARTPADISQWRAELPSVVASLDLGKRPLLLVMPEARARLDAVLAVLGGFRDAGATVPALGLSLLVEGNDGPPMCDAEVRDAAALAVAGARWLGGLRASAPARDPAVTSAISPPP